MTKDFSNVTLCGVENSTSGLGLTSYFELDAGLLLFDEVLEREEGFVKRDSICARIKSSIWGPYACFKLLNFFAYPAHPARPLTLLLHKCSGIIQLKANEGTNDI